MFTKSAVSQDAPQPRSVCFLGFSVALFSARDPSGDQHATLHVGRTSNLAADHKEFCRQVVRDWAVQQPLEVVRAANLFPGSSRPSAQPLIANGRWNRQGGR